MSWIDKVKKVGRANARMIPESIQEPHGKQTIQIKEGGTWSTVAKGVDKSIAEQSLADASVNRVILG